MTEVKPLVFKNRGKQRLGKGFSLGELKEVKLSMKQALKLSIPVDSRRRTIHESNVKALKEFLAKIVKPEKASKSTAEEKGKKGKARSVKKKRSKQ
ncbi:ribosomal protein L13e [Candidatus Bathyarchaeota archaeon]|nr:ribosomal protein L13e [Candidatus Bathyarchaeota archaeon]